MALRWASALGITLFVAFASCGGDGEQQPTACLAVPCPAGGLRVTIANPPPEAYRVEATAAGQTTPLVQECSTGGQCSIFFLGFLPDRASIKVVGTFDTNTYDVTPMFVSQVPGACAGGCRTASTAVTFTINRSPNGGVSVYKSRGLQCATLLSLTDLQAPLSQAGIPILSAACGNDGVAYPTLCGAPDGRIGIFEIAAADVASAQALGFADVNTLPPEARRTGC